MMQLLPPELKCLIVELSSGSPNSLAALARTHTSFQKAAENALYHTLSIFVYNDDSLKCMETLATNSVKAALVHFLTIEYAPDDLDKNRRAATYLSKSLINMHSLSDLRVRSRPDGEEHMKGLDKILWSVCKKIDLFKPSNNSSSDTVKVIFDYKLSTATNKSPTASNKTLTPTATTFSIFLKSLRVKPNCRYLDCTMAVRETS